MLKAILTRELCVPTIRISMVKDVAAVYSASNAVVIVKQDTATTAAHVVETRISMSS